ncbi:MAG: MBL fold metallo-hydrolase [Planctomycetota bacterium]|nr:MBL fold metallo-hydrolase [Planctomycetota bacterium]
MVRDPRAVDVVSIAHPLGCRSYLVVDPTSREALVVDPLLDHVRETLDALSEQRARLRWIIDTHAHGDHFSGAAALRERTGADIVAHPSTEGSVPTCRAEDGQVLELGAQSLVIHHAPGITRDALVVEAPGALFTGDTLLIGTVGLRDAPGSDPHAWYETLHRVFGTRDEGTVLHPGHDDMGRDLTTLKAERRGNRWLREDDREAFLALFRADERKPRKDAAQVLEANRQGLTTVPQDVQAASGFAAPTDTVEERGAAARYDAKPALADSGGLAGLLILCGALSAVGTVLGWWWRSELHALSLLGALIMLGAGLSALESRRRVRSRKEPDFYYTGPSRHTGPPQ